MTADQVSDTRERLLVVAERLFAERGFRGTSVRDIIEGAGVHNGAGVGYHFGSKLGLYEVVIDRVVAPVNEESGIALDALAQRPETNASHVLEAMIRPLVRLQRTDRGELSARLLARQLVERPDGTDAIAPGRAGETVARVADALAAALPERDRAELEWRLCAAIGVLMAHTLGFLGAATGPGEDEDVVVGRLVSFTLAGLCADAAVDAPAAS